MIIRIQTPHHTGYTVVWTIEELSEIDNTVIQTHVVSSFELSKIITNLECEIQSLSLPNNRGRRKIQL